MNVIKNSQLQELIREIVNTLIQEANELGLDASPNSSIIKLDNMVKPLQDGITALFPNSYVVVRVSRNIMDSIGIWFSLEPREQWVNNIFHNASHIILMINEKNGRQREGDSGIYEVSAGSAYKLPKFRKATGHGEKIVAHIIKYFKSIAAGVSNPTPVSEETTTSAVAPVTTPMAFSKKKVMENEDKIKGKFVNRGEVKLEGGVDQKLADKIAHYHWDVMQSMGKDERGVFNYKTRGDRWCCSVGLLHGQPAILSITTEAGRLQLLVGDMEIFGVEKNGENISEMTASSSAGSYNIPQAFSRRGASEKGIEGSEKLGYKLTDAGKQELNRTPDKMIE